MPTRCEAHARFTSFYYGMVVSSGQAFDRLDTEFPQIALAINSLTNSGSDDQAQKLLDFLQALFPYLQARQMNRVLLDYCRSALQAASRLGANPGWLYLLAYQAHWALGEWQAALLAVETAVKMTKDVVPSVHARAVLALGSAQLNQGQYRLALKTLAESEVLLATSNDELGVAAAKSEVAAYYLNRSEYAKALALFQEVADLESRTGSAGPSDHTRFMLGVTYRRVGAYEAAIRELSELIRRSEKQQDHGAVATANHHLAWTLFECGQLDRAERLGQQAKDWYDYVRDPRGSSDADEQLGALALARHDLASAQEYLERSLSVRKRIGNAHGAASSLRRLTRCYLAQGDFRRGLASISASLTIYFRMGVLSRQRIVRIVQELLGRR